MFTRTIRNMLLWTGFTSIIMMLSFMVAVHAASAAPAIIPKPVSFTAGSGTFTLTGSTTIYVQGNNAAETDELYGVGQYLASKLKPATGYAFNVVKSGTVPSGSIYITTIGGNTTLGNEWYKLDTATTGVKLTAFKPEGAFRGIQTIRQMLPAAIEKGSLVTGVSWTMECSSITDYPTYSWRGNMLDVARHFFSVEDVKRNIDLMAQYKINVFHIHLTDDQGWRIQINSWPDLTTIGGSTEVGGGPGGYYTQAQYTDIVNYAKERYITIVPEIDMPGHTNAALASYGELNPDGVKKPLYTGTNVGFSTLMPRAEITYTFVNDVIRELAALTPGQYIHIGGDEAHSTSAEDYDYFIGRVSAIVASHGKKMIGWNPSLRAGLLQPGSMMQSWYSPYPTTDEGFKMVLSPADKAYIDMKYDSTNPIGLTWAGYNRTDDAYQWDPTNYVPASTVAGVEAPLWTETVTNIDEVEYLTYPRLPGHAEVGWTPKSMRSWDEYKNRLKAHGPRMTNQGIDFYKDPIVPWDDAAPVNSVNLSQGKPATASSTETSAFTPNLAVDGDSATRWSSKYSDPQWLQVDLGASYKINQVILNWEAAYARAFQIQVSNDGTAWTTIYSTTTGTGGLQNLQGLSGSGRYVRMYGTQRGTTYGYSLREFQVYGTNLAQGKPVTASSTETSAFTPNLAVDGDQTTRWSSLRSDPQWLQIDLGTTVNVRRVVLNWEAAYGKAYQIQVSNNATSWTTIYSTTTGDGGTDDLQNLNGSGRYIRILGTQRATIYGYSLYEFKVFGH